MTACSGSVVRSDKVEQALIFQQYNVTYDAESGELVATAKFNENNAAGASIRLSDNAQVTFNSAEMRREKEASSVIYRVKQSAEALPDALAFQYQNDDGQIFDNALQLKTFALKTDRLRLHRATENVFTFSGSVFLENEILEAVLVKEDEIVGTLYPEIIDSHKINIDFGDLPNFQAGEYALYFVRIVSSIEVNALDRGGLWETEYQTKRYEVVVE